jgi:hypothetical protein
VQSSAEKPESFHYTTETVVMRNNHESQQLTSHQSADQDILAYDAAQQNRQHFQNIGTPIAEDTLGKPFKQYSSFTEPTQRPQFIAGGLHSMTAKDASGRPPKPFVQFDEAKQKRQEISQFLEKNGAGEISAILPHRDPNSMLPSGKRIINTDQSVLDNANVSGQFNRTDMRIFQELFPDRSLIAQGFIQVGIGNKKSKGLLRSPSFSNQGNQMNDQSSMHNLKRPASSSAISHRNGSSQANNSNFRIRNPKKRLALDVDNA